MKWKHPINTPTYNSWKAMKYRVKNNVVYKQKNITICPTWYSFDNFIEDMGERPEGTTLDRKENLKGYYPENCRWVNMRVQQNNKELLTEITNKGETLTIGQWIDRLGLDKKQRNTVYRRHCSYGAVTFEELFTPNRLSTLRLNKRINYCQTCLTEKTCKWRKHGTQCNTCWHRQYKKKDDIAGYAQLPKKFNHGRGTIE